MTSELHLAYGIGAGRRRPDQEHAQLREAELLLEDGRRARRVRRHKNR